MRALRIFMLAGLVFAAPVFAQPTPGELIDIAGRQRMLSQRIIKAYAQAAQQVHYETSLKQLQASIRLFQDQLGTLSQHAPSDGARSALKKVEELWGPFAATAQGELDRAGATELMLASESLLQACQEVVTQFESAYGIYQTRLVNLSGRQRMLSQRITKAYMLLSWGFSHPHLTNELEQASDEFERALAQLRAEPTNTPEINEALVKVGREWGVFHKYFQLREKTGEYIPFFIAVAAEHILNTMEEVTAGYARLDATKSAPP